MNKRIVRAVIALGLSGIILPGTVFAKALPPQVGSVQIFISPNARFSLERKILGYPDGSPSECTFKKGEEVIWRKEIPATPGIVDITDDGKYIAMVNYGWYDEGGYKSVSFYDQEGELMKEIKFGNSKKEAIWIKNTGFSANGKHYLITEESGKKHSFKLE